MSTAERIDRSVVPVSGSDKAGTSAYEFSFPSLDSTIESYESSDVLKSYVSTYAKNSFSWEKSGEKDSFESENDKRIGSLIYDLATERPVTKRGKLIQNRFVPLQEWEGCVLEVFEDYFVARLFDVTDPSNPKEETDFYIEDLQEDDKILLREGAIFRWVIGYHYELGGTKRRSSQIVFRRLPVWRKPDIESAEMEAEKIQRKLGWL